jgi:hypothetical protein
MRKRNAEPEWISLVEAANRLAISRWSVVAMIRAGKLLTRHIPGSWTRVDGREVDALAASCTRRGIPTEDLPPHLRERVAATERRRKSAGAKLQDA